MGTQDVGDTRNKDFLSRQCELQKSKTIEVRLLKIIQVVIMTHVSQCWIWDLVLHWFNSSLLFSYSSDW
jgi:hypothetical protein